MEKNVFDLSANYFRFEFDVEMPLSQKDDFLSRYRGKSWNNEKDGRFVYGSDAMSLSMAKGFCESLPDYSKVVNVLVYPSGDSNTTRIYMGPMMVSEKDAVTFAEKRLEILENIVKNMERDKREFKKIRRNLLKLKPDLLQVLKDSGRIRF